MDSSSKLQCYKLQIKWITLYVTSLALSVRQYLLGSFQTSFHSIWSYNEFQKGLRFGNNVVLRALTGVTPVGGAHLDAAVHQSCTRLQFLHASDAPQTAAGGCAAAGEVYGH